MTDSVRFTLLGSPRARWAETELPVGSPLQQAMLAVLLLRAGRPIGAGELIEAMWGECAPPSASSMLRTYAWRWRKALEPVGEDLLHSVGDGYRMVVPAGAVDAARAERLAADILALDPATTDGEGLSQARRLLDEALELWCGEPLTGVPGPFAEQWRGRLAELRIDLLEQHCEVELRLGRAALAVPVLDELTTGHPLRERPHALLMRAYYLGGRQVDALACYDRVRRVLAEELGVDPGPELRELHRRILAGDPGLLAVAGPAEPPAPSPTPTPTPSATATATATATADEPEAQPEAHPVPAQLPADTADFTGRTAELAALRAALGEDAGTPEEDRVLPIAAIAGMGGVGKTAVALRVAHQLRADYPDGQLYADLRGDQPEPADPRVLLASFLAALGVGAAAVPESGEDRARLFRSLLDGRRVLVLLDNARDAAQVRPLLPGSARCAVLVTGRSRLFGLPTAAQIDLDVFSAEEASGLLARVAGPPRVTADPAAAGELMHLCGHLPLAVRIVAARLASRPAWTVGQLAARLEAEQHRIAELRVGDLAVSATFDWGYRQLTRDQARAFRLVAAVSRPDIGLAAAAAVLGADERRAELLLESLVDAGMVIAPRPGRYRYHELLRVFAGQLPDGPPPGHGTPAGYGTPPAGHGSPGDPTEPGHPADGAPGNQAPGDGGERRAALRRQLDFLFAGATAAFRVVVADDPVAGVLRAAAGPSPDFADAAAAAEWVATEFDATITAILATVAERPTDEEIRVAADLLIALSPFTADPRCAGLAVAAAAVATAAERAGDRGALGRAEFIRGNLAVQAGRPAEAEAHSRRAAEACRALNDVVVLQQVLNDLGLVAQFRRDYEEAVALYDEAGALARALGHRTGETTTTLNAALARTRAGRAGEAETVCRDLLPGLRAAGDPGGLTYALYILGLAGHAQGRYRAAAEVLEECLRLCDASGLRLRRAQARYRLADTRRLLGRSGEAVELARRAVDDCAELGAERDEAQALVVLARALATVGRAEEAGTRLHRAQALFARLGLPESEDTRLLMVHPAEPAEAS
ncbi:AfsR/SARP family transcriptional regulator [Kitasatospora sp. NPDC004240]